MNTQQESQYQTADTGYEPPAVIDAGEFGDITRGKVFAGTSDDGTGSGMFYA